MRIELVESLVAILSRWNVDEYFYLAAKTEVSILILLDALDPQDFEVFLQ